MTSSPSSQEPWSLVGKTAIVTGASRGIGKAIAIHLARKGLSKLAITFASNSQAARETLDECRKLGVEAAVAIQADALDPSFGTMVVSQTLEHLSTESIDILVNNAVLGDPSKVQPVSNATLPVFLEVMQANVLAPISLTTAVLPHLPPYGGRVVTISSVLAYQANLDPTMTYGASKAALQSYTRSLAEQFSKTTKATFNSVIVGLTATDTIKSSQDLLPAGISYWQLPPLDGIANHQSQDLPTEADVVIIGSGMSGTSIAWHLLKDNATNPLRIAMIEARQACSGATGRNGGHIRPSSYSEYAGAKQSVSQDEAAKITRLPSAHVDALISAANSLPEEGHQAAEARVVDSIDAFFDEKEWKTAIEQLQVLKRDVPDVGNEWTAFEKEEARNVSLN
ncbi:Short chain dehydrogenase [Colletotrichum sp. SAR11_59]|nr:Short chain dehydrogenase [Colletotrichum sp. SAR11_59]